MRALSGAFEFAFANSPLVSAASAKLLCARAPFRARLSLLRKLPAGQFRVSQATRRRIWVSSKRAPNAGIVPLRPSRMDVSMAAPSP